MATPPALREGDGAHHPTFLCEHPHLNTVYLFLFLPVILPVKKDMYGLQCVFCVGCTLFNKDYIHTTLVFNNVFKKKIYDWNYKFLNNSVLQSFSVAILPSLPVY